MNFPRLLDMIIGNTLGRFVAWLQERYDPPRRAYDRRPEDT